MSLQSTLSTRTNVRPDLPGRFNESDIFNRQHKRYQAILENHIVPPYEVLIHSYSGCNLACDWCIGENVPIMLNENLEVILQSSKAGHSRLGDELVNVDNMAKLVNGIVSYKKEVNLKDYGPTMFQIDNISFSGLTGEPLMAKAALLKAMEIALSHNRRVGIFTNAIRIDDEVIETFKRIAYINVSLDAGNGKTYALLKYKGKKRGEEYFDQVLINIENLKNASVQANTELDVNASFMVYPENFHEIYQAASLLKERGVRFFRLKQDNSGVKRLNKTELKKASEIIHHAKLELEDEYFKILTVHEFNSPIDTYRSFGKCQVTNLMAAVGSDGNLYPCNYHPRPNGFKYGSAVENTFAEIWEGEVRASTKCKLPGICPPTCDPFKKRANEMFWNLENPTI